MQNQKIYKLGELFCGPGGLSLGAVTANVTDGKNDYGITHCWASDYDKDSCETYKRNICPEFSDTVICRDVRDLKVSALPAIDAFAYGFPCNDFSIVGEKKGFHGEYGPLYSYGVNVLNYFKPIFFVAENVGGMRSANNGSALKIILNDLRNAGNGYTLTTHLYKAEEYGVPQTRHRLIIVGIRRDLGLKFKVPKPSHLNNLITAREALERPPIPENAENNELTRQSKSVIERLSYIKPGENAWTAQLPDRLKLNVKMARLSHIYKRLHPDKPSYTVTGSGGGGTHVYHWEEPRALTNRERARIQTFPDDFIFEGSKESVRKQIGMAVPPQLSKIIFSSILKTLAKIDYEWINPIFSEQHEFECFSHEVHKGGRIESVK